MKESKHLPSYPGVFWKPNKEFIKELVDYIGDKKVLELFSGNGYLSSLLLKENIIVKPTSIFSNHDYHDVKMFCVVEEIPASNAVLKYHSNYDILLISWPIVTDQVLKASSLFSKEIIFIGEVTDYSKNHLGGCADDEFFESVEIIHEFNSYKGNLIEKACVFKLKQ